MAQFPMGRNTGRNFPVRGPELDELLELLQNQGLTTQDENTKQRLESLRRADAGTSPLRARLYESLYKTGPVDIGEMTVDQERMPSSVDNSMRFGNTTYAEQGPPIVGGNVPTQRESASFGIPASVANSISQQRGIVSGPLAQRENERLVEEAESKIRAEGFESSGPTMEQMEQGGLILEGERRREANPLQILGAIQRGRKSSIDPQIQQPSMDRVEEGEIAPVGEGVEVGLLERLGNTGIGRAIRDNPELAASGAQLLGGLLSNVAQNRAQRRADRTNRERTGRANLISALTGGRVRPDVERAQADTGGFMSLDTLGKALQGGGAAYKGELARQVEEAERERKAGLDERAAELAEAQAESLDAYRKGTLGQREREFEAQQELLDKQLEQELAKASGKDIPPPKLQEKYKAAGQVIDQVDNLVNLMEDAGAFAKGFGLSTIRFLGFDSAPQFTESGKDTAEIKAAANALVQTLGQDMSGVLSDQDIRFIKEQSIDPEDNMEVALRKAALIRNRLIQSMTQNYNADSQNYNMTAFLPIVEKVVSGGNSGFEDALAQDNISLGK
jgi:hypothetical protein